MKRSPPPLSGVKAHRSVFLRLLFSLLLLAVVPVFIYLQLSQADRDRNDVLLESLRAQGMLIARSLTPTLRSADAGRVATLDNELSRLSLGDLTLKLFFRPDGAETGAFYYVAAVPQSSGDALAQDMKDISESGMLAAIWRSCSGQEPLSRRINDNQGNEELLISVTPVAAGNGCWALVTGTSAGAVLATSLGQKYWQSPEIVIAFAIYCILAVTVAAVMFDLWRTLRRIEAKAEAIARGDEDGQAFSALNSVPELAGATTNLDRMIARLRRVASEVRAAADTSTHALKTPIGAIVQAVEPLRRAVPSDDKRAHRAIEIIEQSCQRLSSLLATTNQTLEAATQIGAPPQDMVDLTETVSGICESFSASLAGGEVGLRLEIRDHCTILGSDELIETILENLVDNALSVAPVGSSITVELARVGGDAQITVSDSGPGLSEHLLEAAFEKGNSFRPAAQQTNAAGNFGFGLWIVRRAVETMQGSVWAANRPEGGLAVTVRIPELTA